MTQEELNETLRLHKLWLEGNPEGEKANLRYANLQDADLQYADLRCADLRYANLQDADLQHADLRYADLRHANLQGADLDFSCWPLWCGSLDLKVDDRIKRQLLYHLLSIAPEYRTPELLAEANKFHRVPEVPILTEIEVKGI